MNAMGNAVLKKVNFAPNCSQIHPVSGDHCAALSASMAIKKKSPRCTQSNGKMTIISVEDSHYVMNRPAPKALVC